MALSATRTAPSCTPRSRTASKLCSSAAAAARCTPASSVVRTTGEVPSSRCATCGASERGDGIAGTPASARRAAASTASAATRSGTRLRSAVTRRTIAAGAAPGAATSAASTALSAGVRASGVVPNNAAAAAPTPASSPRKSTRFRYASRIWSFDQACSSARARRAWAHFWASVRAPPRGRRRGSISDATCIVIVLAPRDGPPRRAWTSAAASARGSTPACSAKRRSSTATIAVRSDGEIEGSGTQSARRRVASMRRVSSTTPWRSRSRASEDPCAARTAAKGGAAGRVAHSPSAAASVTPPQASAACRRVIGPRRARSASRRTAPARRAPRPGWGGARRCRAGSAGWRT